MGLVWNSGMETGIRQIDLQHQELIDLINEAEAAHESGRDGDIVNDVIPRLSAYILFHFGTEESLLAGYPIDEAHASAHRQAHREFAARIIALRESASPDKPQDIGGLLSYLQDWLREHILKTDKELGRLLTLTNRRRR